MSTRYVVQIDPTTRLPRGRASLSGVSLGTTMGITYTSDVPPSTTLGPDLIRVEMSRLDQLLRVLNEVTLAYKDQRELI